MARSQCEFLVLSFTSDWLYPHGESYAIADALTRIGRPVEHVEIDSSAGHDAFLVDYQPQAPLITDFLDGLQG